MMIELTKLDPPEAKRTYTFENGREIVLVGVTHFLMRESGNHRLRTQDGKLHIVAAGWIHIEIEAKDFTV